MKKKLLLLALLVSSVMQIVFAEDIADNSPSKQNVTSEVTVDMVDNLGTLASRRGNDIGDNENGDDNDEAFQALIVHLTSGQQVKFLLDEQPVVTFSGNQVVITTHMNVATYQASDVHKFTYSASDSDGIEYIDMHPYQVNIKDNTLMVAGFEPDTELSVWTVDGIIIASAITDHNGAASILLPDRRGAVYILKSSVTNFKILKS